MQDRINSQPGNESSSMVTPLIPKSNNEECLKNSRCSCNRAPCCCMIEINEEAFSSCVALKSYGQVIFRLDENNIEFTRNRVTNGILIVAILPVIGPAIYTIKEIVHSFKESISWGAVRSIVAAGGGVAGWFASETLATVISHSTSHYVSPDITKPIVQSWLGTIGSASTAFLSNIFRCHYRVHNNPNTLFGKNLQLPKQRETIIPENKRTLIMG